MQRLYFVRHGLSELGAKGLYAGRTETPLAQEGRVQARQAGQAARTLGIDMIVSSPLKRTLETAQIMADEMNYPREKVVVSPLLIERDFGALEAQPYRPRRHYQDVPGIETDDRLIKRAQQALEWLETLPATNLLVVGHAGFGRALRSILQPYFPMSHPHRMQNAEIYRLL